MTTTVRILGAGSRSLTDRTLVRRALTEQLEAYRDEPYDFRPEQILVIHGGQGYVRKKDGVTVGADLLIDQEAKALGMLTDPHPADWHASCRPRCDHGLRKRNRWGRDYCQMAGMYRNGEMVDLRPKADICVAFPLEDSLETRDCMRKAKEAGIEVVVYESLGCSFRFGRGA